MLIKSHDINRKSPQKIKVPESKIDDAHNENENLRNIILLKTQQIIMELKDNVKNKSHSIMHSKDEILFKPHNIINELQQIKKSVHLRQ